MVVECELEGKKSAWRHDSVTQNSGKHVVACIISTTATDLKTT